LQWSMYWASRPPGPLCLLSVASTKQMFKQDHLLQHRCVQCKISGQNIPTDHSDDRTVSQEVTLRWPHVAQFTWLLRPRGLLKRSSFYLGEAAAQPISFMRRRRSLLCGLQQREHLWPGGQLRLGGLTTSACVSEQPPFSVAFAPGLVS
jgi:hypothetical protein